MLEPLALAHEDTLFVNTPYTDRAKAISANTKAELRRINWQTAMLLGGLSILSFIGFYSAAAIYEQGRENLAAWSSAHEPV